MYAGRVLIIDDDDVARLAMSELLESCGYETFEFPSPIGVTRVILKERIDAVVIDVNMPTMNGDKLATLLKKNPRLASLGVVLVSGCSSEDLAEIASAVDASDVVHKSQLTDKLPAAVKASLPELTF